MSLETTNDHIVRDEAAIRDADLPRNVVFFDGVCGLCNYSVDFILSRDRRRTIRLAPLQGETAARWIPNPESQLSTFVWLDHQLIAASFACSQPSHSELAEGSVVDCQPDRRFVRRCPFHSMPLVSGDVEE